MSIQSTLLKRIEKARRNTWIVKRIKIPRAGYYRLAEQSGPARFFNGGQYYRSEFLGIPIEIIDHGKMRLVVDKKLDVIGGSRPWLMKQDAK